MRPVVVRWIYWQLLCRSMAGIETVKSFRFEHFRVYFRAFGRNFAYTRTESFE